MRALSKRIVGFALLFLIAVSAYLTIVQIVEAFKPDGILKAFSVKSLRQPNSSGKFLMGDTLVVEAKSDVATDYELQVRVNSSTVFESEWAGGSPLRLEVPLLPPAFTPGKSYTLGLNGFVTNSPIPGACFADFASYTFDVASTQTTVGLNSTYDDVMKNLYAFANLTDVDGYPVVNEAVDFSVQLKSADPLTDGWIPVGSSVTDSNGTAKLSVGFDVPPVDQMKVKASHEANANFGGCEKTVDVEVISSFDESLLYMSMWNCNSGNTGETDVSDPGTVSMSTNVPGNSPAYALLSINVTASYNSTTPLPGPYSAMFFYLDSINNQSVKSCPNLLLRQNSSYVYDATYFWGPTAVDAHTLFAAVASGNSTDMINAQNGIGLIASGNITLYVTGCPSNLVLNIPEAVYGNFLPVSVGFSRAKCLAANDMGEFTTSSLAPQFKYGDLDYVIDEPVNVSVPVSLYVNGTLNGTSMTDANGLASFQYPLGFSGACSNLSINCTANCSGLVFQQVNVTRNVTFTNVTVSDTNSGNGVFQLNCTVDGQGASYGLENGPIYVGTDNQVGLSAMLNGSPVWGAPASALVGKPLNRTNTNSSGCAPVAKDSTFLRVDSLYDLNSAAASSPSADINRDGKVDGKDLGTINKAFGTLPGDSRWNWRADLNFDMKVDGKDVASCARYFGSFFSYVSVSNYSGVTVSFLVNGQWNAMSLDGSGCAGVPSASYVSFTLGGSPVGAVVEFFNCTSGDQACFTDNSGQSVASWVPPETGDCSSVSSGLVTLKGYLALIWLPPSFQVATSQGSNVTSDRDPVILAIALNVVKRPVTLSLTNSSFQCSVALLDAVANTFVDEAEPTTNFGGESEISAGFDYDFWLSTNEVKEELAYVRFNISSIPSNCYVLSARLKLMPCGGVFAPGGCVYVYRVTSYWDEYSLNWTSRPSFASSPTCGEPQIPIIAGGFVIWDVTNDVRIWYGNSSTNNYGEMLSVNPSMAQSFFYTNHAQSLCYSCVHPVLEVTYVPLDALPVNLTATLADGVSGTPISADISFSVNGVALCNNMTDLNGTVATAWSGPLSGLAYDVTASYSGNATFEAASASVCLDFRTPTQLELCMNDTDVNDGDVLSVNTYDVNRFYCWVSPWGVFNRTASVSINGSLYSTPPLLDNNTCFVWTAGVTGVYYLNFSYAGGQNYRLSEVDFAAIAQASPCCLSFKATPTEFRPGDQVTLTAQAMNPFTNQSLNGVYVEFWENGTQGSCIANVSTYSDGVATATWNYPENGTATVTAMVSPNQALANCTLAVQPITLTVGSETRLLLSAWRDPGGTGHTIYARLLDAGGSYISNQTVTLNVNGTAYTLQANGTGYVTLHLTLQPGDTSANMYQIMATFNGTNPRSASINGSDPYGNQYAVCTTTQYDLRPATNSSTLTVLLQSTDALTAAKTPEQMQKEAEESGQLKIKNEFTRWYPWYRFHMVYLLHGVEQLDVGIGLLGGNVLKAWQDFVERISRYVKSIVPDLFADYVLGEMVAWAGAVSGNLLAWAIAAGISVGVKLGLLLAESWNSLEKLYTSYVAQFVSLMIEVGSFIAEFSLGHLIGIAGSLMKLTSAVWAVLTLIANILLDITFFMSIIDMRISQLGGQ